MIIVSKLKRMVYSGCTIINTWGEDGIFYETKNEKDSQLPKNFAIADINIIIDGD